MDLDLLSVFLGSVYETSAHSLANSKAFDILMIQRTMCLMVMFLLTVYIMSF